MKPALLLAAALALPADPDRGPDPADVAVVAGAQNAFGGALYEAVRDQPGNLCLSPTSVYAALLLAHVGARGATAAELERVLGIGGGASLPEGWTARRGHEAFRALVEKSELATDEATVRVVNALWGQEGHPFLPACLAELERLHGAGLRTVDYRRHTEAAREAITAWVAERTNDRIRDLLQKGDVIPATRLVLTNAVYFKDAWQWVFPEGRTEPAPFHVAGGDAVEVPTMHLVEPLRYAETADARLVELPFRNSPFGMTLVVPKAIDGLEAIEADLDIEEVALTLAEGKGVKVALALPKFTFERRFGLGPALKSMGLRAAFGDQADFSGFDDGAGGLVIDDVIHKTFVAVDEEGAEAAAATAITIRATSVDVRPPLELKVDRPFLFLIRHRTTGHVLFLGRVVDPRG